MTLPLALPSSDDARGLGAARPATGSPAPASSSTGCGTAPPADALEMLRRWDRSRWHLSNVARGRLAVRQRAPRRGGAHVARQAEVEVDRLGDRAAPGPRLYDVFAGARRAGLDAGAARLLSKTLDDFRRAGVDRDDATRARLAEINERLTELGQEFSRAIRDDVRTIRVTPERLAGLPQDWLDAHPADDDGLVTVTTDYPDAVPVRMFAHDAEGAPRHDRRLPRARLADQRGAAAGDVRAAPRAGEPVGYADWASYDADVKMIEQGPGDPGVHRQDRRCRRGADAPRPRRSCSSATAATSRTRRRSTPYDSPTTRSWSARSSTTSTPSGCARYFDFDKVRQGLLDVTGRLFGLRYEPVRRAGVARGRDGVRRRPRRRRATIGRIYLDLHPREGKYKHAAQFTLADGVGRPASCPRACWSATSPAG